MLSVLAVVVLVLFVLLLVLLLLAMLVMLVFVVVLVLLVVLALVLFNLPVLVLLVPAHPRPAGRPPFPILVVFVVFVVVLVVTVRLAAAVVIVDGVALFVLLVVLLEGACAGNLPRLVFWSRRRLRGDRHGVAHSRPYTAGAADGLADSTIRISYHIGSVVARNARPGARRKGKRGPWLGA